MRRSCAAALLCLTVGAAGAGAPDTGFSSGIELGGDSPSSDSESATGTDKPADGGRSWWKADTGPGLSLLHAGEFEDAPDGSPAIGLLFSRAFPEGSTGFNDFLAVYRPDGSPVPGRWRRAANPQLLYFNVPGTGEYLVRVRAGLSAGGAATLARSLSGPVTVGARESSE